MTSGVEHADPESQMSSNSAYLAAWAFLVKRETSPPANYDIADLGTNTLISLPRNKNYRIITEMFETWIVYPHELIIILKVDNSNMH